MSPAAGVKVYWEDTWISLNYHISRNSWVKSIITDLRGKKELFEISTVPIYYRSPLTMGKASCSQTWRRISHQSIDCGILWPFEMPPTVQEMTLRDNARHGIIHPESHTKESIIFIFRVSLNWLEYFFNTTHHALISLFNKERELSPNTWRECRNISLHFICFSNYLLLCGNKTGTSFMMVTWSFFFFFGNKLA